MSHWTDDRIIDWTPEDDGDLVDRLDETWPLSRYELLHGDAQFGLRKGDILHCKRMHWAWADEKVAVIRRESDGYEPGCSQYRQSVRHVSGPRS